MSSLNETALAALGRESMVAGGHWRPLFNPQELISPAPNPPDRTGRLVGVEDLDNPAAVEGGA